MKVTVKIIQGAECVLDVVPTETILEIKRKVQESLGIDIEQQTLLLTGKALSDENEVSFYPGIKDGIKLNLIIKKPSHSNQEKSGLLLLQNKIKKILQSYYVEHEAKLIANELVNEIKNKANLLSFDDLERLATAFYHDQESLAEEIC